MGAKTVAQDRYYIEQRGEDYVVLDASERMGDGTPRVCATFSGHNAQASSIEFCDWWNRWSISRDRVGGGR